MIWTTLSFVTVILATSCGSIRRVVYPGNPDTRLPDVPGGTLLETPSGQRTAYAYYVPGKNTPVIFFHGAAGTIYQFEFLARMLRDRGHAVLLVEYPGYGRASRFKPSEKAVYDDCAASLQAVAREYGLDANRAIIWGYSLGSGVAVEFARRGYGSRVVLMAPYTSIPAVGESRTVPLVRYLIVSDRYDNLSKAPGIRKPVLILHGTADKIVPFSMGVTLSKVFPDARLIAIGKAGHYLLQEIRKPVYWEELARFIEQ